MRRFKSRRRLALLSVPIAAGVVLASVSLAAGGESKEAGRALSCQPTNPQPEHPLEMNTVAVGPVAKTVAMEKELFDCQDPEVGSSFTREVETFIEIIERATSPTNLTTVARRVEIDVCDKFFSPPGNVVCRTSRPPLGPPVSNPLQGCQPLPPTGVVRTPPDPVEMNTVVVGELIKTIKLEKEVLGCGTMFGDVYLFTELVERKTTGSAGYVPNPTRFEGIKCLKSPQQGLIVSCTRFTTA